MLWQLNEAGPKVLAEESGGLVLQTNDLVAGLTQVADESRVTYLLGYEPTNGKRDGRYRKLGVEVRRPGLQVRARTGYFAPKGSVKPAPAPAPDPVERALRDLFDADGIPLRLAAYVMGEAPVQSPLAERGFEVLIAGELRLDALQAEVKDGRRVAEPRLKLLTSSRAGESHESEWSLQVTLGPSLPETGDALWHPFVTRIAMTPGDHRARLVVQSGERLGSVTVDFVVPPIGDERLSTPILSDRLVANASGRRLLPLARRAFDATSVLHSWIELEGAALDTGAGQPRAQAAFVARTLDGREWASGPATAMNVERGLATRLVSIPLGNAPPGEHELVLRVKDEVSGATFEAREPFRVEGSARAAAAASPAVATASTDAPPAGSDAGRRATAGRRRPRPAGRDAAAAATGAAPSGRGADVPGRDPGGAPGSRRARRQGPARERPAARRAARCSRTGSAARSSRSGSSGRRARGTPVRPGPGRRTTTSAPPPESSSPSRANLVVLVFGGLNVDMAPSARRAALDLLGRSFPPNTWFAVHKITWQGMRELQPFTSHRDRLRAAVLAATTGDDAKPGRGRALGPRRGRAPRAPPPRGGPGGTGAHSLGLGEAATFKGLLLDRAQPRRRSRPQGCRLLRRGPRARRGGDRWWEGEPRLRSGDERREPGERHRSTPWTCGGSGREGRRPMRLRPGRAGSSAAGATARRVRSAPSRGPPPRSSPTRPARCSATPTP